MSDYGNGLIDNLADRIHRDAEVVRRWVSIKQREGQQYTAVKTPGLGMGMPPIWLFPAITEAIKEGELPPLVPPQREQFEPFLKPLELLHEKVVKPVAAAAQRPFFESPWQTFLGALKSPLYVRPGSEEMQRYEEAWQPRQTIVPSWIAKPLLGGLAPEGDITIGPKEIVESLPYFVVPGGAATRTGLKGAEAAARVARPAVGAMRKEALAAAERVAPKAGEFVRAEAGGLSIKRATATMERGIADAQAVIKEAEAVGQPRMHFVEQELKDIAQEIGNRSLPYHGRAKGNLFPEYNVQELAVRENAFRAVLEGKAVLPMAAAKAPAGLPEAGMQARFTPEGQIVSEPFQPAGRGVPTQIGMDEAARLAEMRGAGKPPVSPIAETPPPTRPPAPPVEPPGGLPVGGEGMAAEPWEAALAKLTDFIKTAKTGPKVRAAATQLKREEMSRRVAASARALGTTEGRQAFFRARARLGGELPKAEFAPPKEFLSPAEWDSLVRRIQTSEMEWLNPHYRHLQRLDTEKVFSEILMEGKVPTRQQTALLENMFGENFAKAIWGKRPVSQKAGETILDLWNIPRTLNTIWDLSAALRQGLLLHGIDLKATLGGYGPMIKAFRRESVAKAVDQAIRMDELFPVLEGRAKIYFAPMGRKVTGGIAQREEAWASSAVSKLVPGARPSERAFITFLNKARFDIGKRALLGWKSEGIPWTDERLGALGRLINRASGRGTLGPAEPIAVYLNVPFFSARLQASRIQIWASLFERDPIVRKMAWKGLVKTFGTVAAVVEMASLLPGVSVERNPLSADWGKIRIGNIRIDPWGGFQQWARFLSQIAAGEIKTVSMGSKMPTDRMKLIGRMARSKESPAFGLIHDIIAGETFIGEDVSADAESAMKQAWNRLTPMALQDAVDSVREEGWPGGLIATPPAIFGVGITAFPESLSKQRDTLRNQVGAALLVELQGKGTDVGQFGEGTWYEWPDAWKNYMRRNNEQLQAFDQQITEEQLEGGISLRNADTYLKAESRRIKNMELEALALRFRNGEIDSWQYNQEAKVVRAEARGMYKAAELVNVDKKRLEKWREEHTLPCDKAVNIYYDVVDKYRPNWDLVDAKTALYLRTLNPDFAHYVEYMVEEDWKKDLGENAAWAEEMKAMGGGGGSGVPPFLRQQAIGVK